VSKEIYAFSRTPKGKRGMGCTAEVVYLNGQRLVMAHVGDSRTYHFTDGRLIQLTRDQTLVNRLVELGQLTPEEAENHPRKNELQQALGAQPVVEPLAYSVPLKAGDWVIICSDGLINHVDHATLTEMIQRADSAEMCARRLVNLANAYGGVDNTTVVAVRAT
jgi:protein phosphatase